MALTSRHRDDGTRLCAWDLDAVQLDRLRGHVVMPCCGRDAQVVISKHPERRVHHFRHQRGVGLSYECEHHEAKSETHVELQDQIERLARAAGWAAEQEAPGPGRAWIADVLLTAPDGRRFSVEVQLSAQTSAAWLTRTEARSADSVTTVWLVAPDAIPPAWPHLFGTSLYAALVNEQDAGWLLQPPRDPGALGLVSEPLDCLISLLDTPACVPSIAPMSEPRDRGLAVTSRHRFRPRLDDIDPNKRGAPFPELLRPSPYANRRPRRDRTLPPSAASPLCAWPKERAPGWAEIAPMRHECSACGATLLSWKVVTCGEGSVSCEHQNQPAPGHRTLIDLTLALAATAPAALSRTSVSTATPRDVDGVGLRWLCSCGALLPEGTTTPETIGVRQPQEV